MLKSHPKGCDFFMVSEQFYDNPKYDEVIWSELCDLKEMGKDYYIGGFDLSVVEKNGKYGMIYTEKSSVDDEDLHPPIYSEYGILDCDYDAIYSLHRQNKGYFVVFQGSKCGLLQVLCSDFNSFCDYREICPCVYDRIELINVGFCEIVIMQSGRKLFYYNIDTGFRSDFYDRIWVEKSFIFCAVGGETEVFYGRNDKFVMKSKNEIDYAGRYKNRYVFIEREGYFEPDENGMPVVNGKICFYREGNNTVLKTKRLKHITVLKKENGLSSETIGLCCGKQKLKNENLHRHYMEIIVSKKEMLEQLRSFAEQDNLLKLLIYGKEISDYELLLQKISLKFELIGSFVYKSEGKTKKFLKKIYQRILFDDRYETFDEVKTQVERICQKQVGDEIVWMVFAKLQFFAETVCRFLADKECWWEDTYRAIIEYTMDCGSFTVGKSGKLYTKSSFEELKEKIFKISEFPDFRR